MVTSWNNTFQTAAENDHLLPVTKNLTINCHQESRMDWNIPEMTCNIFIDGLFEEQFLQSETFKWPLSSKNKGPRISLHGPRCFKRVHLGAISFLIDFLDAVSFNRCIFRSWCVRGRGRLLSTTYSHCHCHCSAEAEANLLAAWIYLHLLVILL